MRVFVPADTAARSVGADEVAARIAELPHVELVRNGSRGLLWLEPLMDALHTALSLLPMWIRLLRLTSQRAVTTHCD